MRSPAKHPLRHGAEWIVALAAPFLLWWALGTYAGEFYRVRVSHLSGGFEKHTILWVDKWNSGARLPFHPLHFTHMHLGDGRPARPYRRVSPLQLSRYDLVVFNHPDPDTLAPDLRLRTLNRVIGLPGDTIRMYHGKLFINGKMTNAPEGTLVDFEAQLTDSTDLAAFEIKYGLREAIWTRQNKFRFKAHPNRALELAGDSLVVRFNWLTEALPDTGVFSTGLETENGDHYGPVLVPYKGMVLDSTAMPAFTERLWMKYERMDLSGQHRNDSVRVFAHDYYFMLSDYRSMGNDSRYYGPIPEYLIIGKVGKVLYTARTEQE